MKCYKRPFKFRENINRDSNERQNNRLDLISKLNVSVVKFKLSVEIMALFISSLRLLW